MVQSGRPKKGLLTITKVYKVYQIVHKGKPNTQGLPAPLKLKGAL